MNNPKLICIARCKNEMHCIEKWFESMPFVDRFCITDNESTDGTFEYLKEKENVDVVQLKRFDEGRDFQILLAMAKSYKPEWILKIDIDEIFEDYAIKNFNELLDQKEYDGFLFRRFTFDYRLPENVYWYGQGDFLTKKLLLSLVRNKTYIDILNVKSHVGSFRFCERVALSNFRMKHFALPSYEKALEKYNTYENMKSSNDNRAYSSMIDRSDKFVNSIPKREFKEIEDFPPIPFSQYAMSTYLVSINGTNTIKPKLSFSTLKWKFKELVLRFVNSLGVNKLCLRIFESKHK